MTVENGDPNSKNESFHWTPLVGLWNVDKSRLEFLRFDDPSFKAGVVLCDVRATTGSFRATAELPEIEESCAHIVVGYDARTGNGYSIGIGGFHRAYALNVFSLGQGARLIFGLGKKDSLQPNRPYGIDIDVRGRDVSLAVDGVEVFQQVLPDDLFGDQLGLFGYGGGGVTFRDVQIRRAKPRAFVVMQFTEPYDSLWQEVIKPVAEKVGFEAYRADDVSRPGIILQDIVRGIRTSDAVIADVTPLNPNVYYELGYAHAIGTPTVLMKERPANGSAPLPFDISGFRCIFYEDAIRGKAKVEAELEKHLRNIYERHGV